MVCKQDFYKGLVCVIYLIIQPRFPISEELRAKLEKFQIELARHLPSDKALENNMDINQLNEKLITSIKQQVRRSAKT